MKLNFYLRNDEYGTIGNFIYFHRYLFNLYSKSDTVITTLQKIKMRHEL